MAVLFRNNHFNTIFYHNGDIYILVTDQGYLFEQVCTSLSSRVSLSCAYLLSDDVLVSGKEHDMVLRCFDLQDVVWEKLCDVNGNTEFVKGDFERFAGSPPKNDVSAAADLAQAAFASVVPPRHSGADTLLL